VAAYLQSVGPNGSPCFTAVRADGRRHTEEQGGKASPDHETFDGGTRRKEGRSECQYERPCGEADEASSLHAVHAVASLSAHAWLSTRTFAP
jgi:hypothetical protein